MSPPLEDELRAWLRLLLAPGVGPETARALLAAFGTPQAIFAQDFDALRALGTERLAQALSTEPPALAGQLASTLDWLAAADDRALVTLADARYPAALRDIADAPLLLFLRGSLVRRGAGGLGDQAAHADQAAPAGGLAALTAAACLAIVGSRNPTPQGTINARQFAQAFSAAGLCVVSGLALGVDGAAHDGALLGGGPTVAVVGTGLDRIYPKSHLALAHRIAERGLIVSEFPLGTPPLAANFPRRNRIISGLSQGTLVIEAALQSGSLITARLAAEQGKEVFAIPGSIHSPQSRGCHLLIKQGAKLVESAQDVLEELRLPPARIGTGTAAGTGTGPNADSAAPADVASLAGAPAVPTPAADPLLQALGFDAVSLDTLQARCGWPTAELQAQLLAFELSGEVARLPGGLFVRIASA